jgi:flagellar M-ring protein FliF
VRTAIGFDQKRGDQVEVVNLRFAEMPANPITEPNGWMSALHFTKDDIMRAIEMGVMGLLGLVVMFMVVRPLVRRVLAPDERPLAALPPSAASGAGQPATPATAAPAALIAEIARAEQSQTAKMIDIAQVQGQVHAQSVQKVGDLADKNPNEAVSIIRQWLHESAAA